MALSLAGLKPRPRDSAAQVRSRTGIAIACFLAVYGAIGARLVQYGLADVESGRHYAVTDRSLASRPDIVDVNGDVLATDIHVASLFGEPRRIVDADEAVEALSSVLPDVDYRDWHRKLSSGAGFVWLRRELTPRQQADVLALGIPGLGFRTEKRRFYPGGPLASHILGLVNIDNAGIAGLEKYVDDQGLGTMQDLGLDITTDLPPVKLSLDARVQYAVRDELNQALERYQAIAAGAVVLNARTGEVVAMASLPDYDPNNPYNALDKDRLNRMSGGVFEMGSTFKSFTTAMALDTGVVNIDSRVDTRPFRVSGYTIKEFHNKGSSLTVPEIFKYSSNVGSAREADMVGIEGHREFLTRLGLLSRLETELPEVATPTQPNEWKKINSMTISFGHGVATTPLNTAVAAAALMNGGWLIPPTFLPRSEEQAAAIAKRVISEQTSRYMRELYDLNGAHGSGRQALVEGYGVGGKTGTAEKVINGRYVGNKRFNAYLASFPINDPKYVVLVVVDEPKPVPGSGQGATAASNAAPTAGAIIRRSAPLLGITPEFGDGKDALLVSY
ncbi:peptidoglycan D,D-transpeptidase FtsI family protein [Oricola indica]|jgi:cell division protein FtsI (penicillin-binding protein 3)|uniref:peptidoglycan D,D-transpeptidase FtsI family protein n=1 Tax=Oricola indica TaxID=2872591 RepID=UPI001CC1B5E6|nr:penicillin-binding protein 2 [Oricola indica]